MALINSLCAMLRVSPFHRENYSRLILGVIIQFYQRCSDRFQDLVSVPGSHESQLEPRLALAAQWAQSSQLNPCLSELLTTSVCHVVELPPAFVQRFNMLLQGSDTAKQQQLCRQETNLELELLGQKTVTKADLVPAVRNLAALANLYRSVVNVSFPQCRWKC